MKGLSPFLRTRICYTTHTWTPPKPLGPKKRSHSAVMSAQRHSNSWTMVVLPYLMWGLCWARLSPNRATRINNFIFLDEWENHSPAVSPLVFILHFFSHGPIRGWQISTWILNRCFFIKVSYHLPSKTSRRKNSSKACRQLRNERCAKDPNAL